MSDWNGDLPIIITAQRSIIDYISAVTKTDAKMILVEMRDMSNKAIVRLQERLENSKSRHGESTWTYVTYPGTDMRFRVEVSTANNYHLQQLHAEERRKTYEAQGGLAYDRGKGRNPKVKGYRPSNWKEHNEAWITWQKENPSPYQGYDYKCIRSNFIYKPDGDIISISQSEIDTILIEDILFAPTSQDKEEEPNEH